MTATASTFSYSLLQQFSTATPDQALETTIPIDIDTNYKKFQALISNQLIQLVGIVLMKSIMHSTRV